MGKNSNIITKRIGNLRIKVKLILLLLFPLAGLIIFSALGLFEKYQVSSRANDLQEMVRLSVFIDAYIHESQKERGRTATFVASKGRLFRTELGMQRRVTDERLKPLRAALASHSNTGAGSNLGELIRRSLAGIDQLESKRAQIDALEISAQAARKYYTDIHRNILVIVQQLAVLSTDRKSTNMLQAYSMIMHIKEAAGQERALLSQVFAQDRFSSGGLIRLHHLVTQQETYLMQFLAHTTDKQQANYRMHLGYACVADAERTRRLALKKGGSGNFGVDPAHWFRQISCKIDHIKKIDDSLAKDLIERLGELVSSSRFWFVVYLVGTLLLLVLSLWIASIIVRVITRQTTKLSTAMNKLAEGDLNAQLEAQSEDEIGQLSGAFNTMAEKIRNSDEYRNQVAEQEVKAATELKQRVGVMRDYIEKVAQGDLTKQLAVSGEDDLADLGHYLNEMTTSLAAVARQITAASQTMGSTLKEVQSVINEQSAGASEQAASVSETTATLEEIKATSTQTLDKATALGETAVRTRQEGERGREAVDQTIAAMGTIRDKVGGIAENILSLSEQTQQIGDITNTVNNLAQQLKMLALNASIEAGKAGEAGKGFAVVANEVKELAEQSQQATEQVHRILQDITHATDRAVMVTEEGTKGVEEGTKLVEQTGEAVRNLSDVIRETETASQQIVAAVRQEAAGIDQIVTAMNDINQATTQFVTSSNQTKVAAEDLGKVAAELRDGVSVYKV